MNISKTFDWTNEPIVVDVSIDNIQIKNSFKIRKVSHMLSVIQYIKQFSDYSKISKRSTILLLLEWRAHNILYRLGVERSRTRSCDFGKEPIIRMVLFTILSLIPI